MDVVGGRISSIYDEKCLARRLHRRFHSAAVSKDQVHDSITADLVSRLEASGRYDALYVGYHYDRGNYRGELDVLALSADRPDVAHYYEVKSSYNRPNLAKAEHQAYCVSRAFDFVENARWQFILVTPEHIQRIEPHCHHRRLSRVLRDVYRCKHCGMQGVQSDFEMVWGERFLSQYAAPRQIQAAGF